MTRNLHWRTHVHRMAPSHPLFPSQFFAVFLFCYRAVFFASYPLTPGNFSLSSYTGSKILALKTPLPLGISNELPWSVNGFFLQLHIAILEALGSGRLNIEN